MVNALLSGLTGHGLFVYLDDIIIVSKDLDTHLQQLGTVLSRLTEAGLKVKLSKLFIIQHTCSVIEVYVFPLN